MDKFKNKYRIPSARLQTWDYGADGAYFITICTHNREHFFGKIYNGEMQLNELGQLAQNFWAEIPNHFPFVELGNFVVMPNHTHGILIINRNEHSQMNNNGAPPAVQTLHCNVSAQSAAQSPAQSTGQSAAQSAIQSAAQSPAQFAIQSPILQTLHCNVSQNKKSKQMAKISPKPGSIPTIIRSYKSVVSKNAKLIRANFAWQTRFHDHIIRNARSFENIQNYIENNPSNWKEDTFHKNNDEPKL